MKETDQIPAPAEQQTICFIEIVGFRIFQFHAKPHHFPVVPVQCGKHLRLGLHKCPGTEVMQILQNEEDGAVCDRQGGDIILPGPVDVPVAQLVIQIAQAEPDEIPLILFGVRRNQITKASVYILCGVQQVAQFQPIPARQIPPSAYKTAGFAIDGEKLTVYNGGYIKQITVMKRRDLSSVEAITTPMQKKA